MVNNSFLQGCPDKRRGTAYCAEWSWPTSTEKWVQEKCFGLTLNVPCGSSKIGDVRADIDLKFRPDVVCDLKHPPFREGAFDSVVCDPPFSIFFSGKNRFGWMHDLARVTSRRIMFSTPAIALRLGRDNWRKTWYVLETGLITVRLWQVFDKYAYFD